MKSKEVTVEVFTVCQLLGIRSLVSGMERALFFVIERGLRQSP